MHIVADTEKLVGDGIISEEQAGIIKSRSRETMVALGINSVLCLGILAATGGLIFWLADAATVAVCGSILLAAGLIILAKGRELVRMFGNAAALIGAGMLIGGAAVELIDKYEDFAGGIMLSGGAFIMLLTTQALNRTALAARFVVASILLMGLAFHLVGAGLLADQHDLAGAGKSLLYLYSAVAVAGTGMRIDVRLVTALAIVPFVQMLETGTGYFHAAYVFYSPEPTLSILQLGLLIVLCFWLAGYWRERWARHARILMVMAFIVANLCALVGSLWGDVVGETLWGPGHRSDSGLSWEEYETARDIFRMQAFVISEELYAIVWAGVLALMVFWAAHTNHRGLFNASLTFGGIHAYTQLFESFGDEPLTFVIGGFAAIPLAWSIWRLNHWLVERAQPDRR